VQPCEERPRRELDGDRLVLKRTFEQRDDGSATWAVLGVGRISYPRQVPSVLDQHVLKSTSSADQRDVPLARRPHNFVNCFLVAVRPGPMITADPVAAIRKASRMLSVGTTRTSMGIL
jgi:hypothetical protein